MAATVLFCLMNNVQCEPIEEHPLLSASFFDGIYNLYFYTLHPWVFLLGALSAVAGSFFVIPVTTLTTPLMLLAVVWYFVHSFTFLFFFGCHKQTIHVIFSIKNFGLRIFVNIISKIIQNLNIV